MKRAGETLSQKVLKVMALFTGMQFFTILCSIIKTKLVAMWLGADGVGLTGILNTTIETTSTLTDMGLRQSAVRDVAQSASKPAFLARTAAVVRRWSGVSGLLGAVVVSALCMPLSDWFFGTTSRWWMFALLSFAVLCNAVAGGEQALLQGAGRLKPLLRVNAIGAAAGLLLSVPLYRWCGLTGIVWSVILYAVCGLIAAFILRLRTGGFAGDLSAKALWDEGKGFVKLGMWMAVAAFVTNMAQMAFMAYLSSEGSLTEVGYYQGGTTLIVRYMGLIFTAMGMEYYPRLAANAFSARRTCIFVNREAKVLLVVLIPIITLFLLFRQQIILLLYTSDFEAAVPFITWAVLSCVFKATSWCMAFVILARGDGRIYILTESVDAVAGLALCVVGYRLCGLAGVGIAYVAWYALYTLMVGYVFRYRYHMKLQPGVVVLAAVAIVIGIGEVAVMEVLPYQVCCILLGAVTLATCPFLLRLWRRRRPSNHP